MKKWVRFSVEYFIDGKWIEDINIYYIDMNEIDMETDWRFKDVPNKRRNYKIL